MISRFLATNSQLTHRFPRSKCHPSQGRVKINELSPQVLARIVCRGGIEYIVSMERISRNFGAAVGHVLASVKSISVRDMKTVIELTKRMPRLRKFTSNHLPIEHAKELARNNQGIIKFVSTTSQNREVRC